MTNDTIAAIATSSGIGSISIIRISGNESISIVNSIFRGKDLNKVVTHTITYGYIVDENNILDEVLVTVMREPRTFTKENVVEINCHGGIATTKSILNLLIQKGARLAEPGEFTKRAFLNGRIDLVEAEGVMDLIESKTEQMRKISINQVNGNISKKIKRLRNEIIEILAHIEVNIDYPEYEDVGILTNEKILPKIEEIKMKMENILEKSNCTLLIKEGILTSIIGRPNVGKSSLLNKLIEENKAIVTDIPGTTRDIVEGKIYLEGILLNVVDTAGIRETEDLVESIGVKKSLELLEKANLVLLVLNYNEEINKDELEILKLLENKNHIIIINKIDLPKKINDENLKKENIVYISTIEDKGIDILKRKIIEIYHLEKIDIDDPTYLTNIRSISLLKSAKDSIDSSIENISNNFPLDIVEIDLKKAWNDLGEIIGETYSEELIDQIFSRFCLGK